MDFRVGGKSKKNCYWVTYKPKRRIKVCKKDDVPGACPISCGLCCENDADFTFKTKNKVVKDCQWIQNQYERRREYCDERKKVRAHCPGACGCFDPVVSV